MNIAGTMDAFLEDEGQPTELTIEQQLRLRYGEPLEDKPKPLTEIEQLLLEREHMMAGEAVEGEAKYEAQAAPAKVTDSDDMFAGLLLPQKFLLLGLIGLLMLAIPTGFYVYGAYKNIKTANAEIAGVDPVKDVLKLVRSFQEHRSYATQVASGNTEAEKTRAIKAKEIESALFGLDTVMAQQVANPTISKDWGIAKEHMLSLLAKIKNGGLSADDVINAHTKPLDDLYGIIDKIATHSGLPLDPEEGSYFMMRSAVYSLPKLIESLERSTAPGVGLLSLKKPDPTLVAIMNSYFSLATASKKESFKELQQGLDVSPKAKENVQSLTTKVLNKVDKTFRDTNVDIIDKQDYSRDPADFAEDMRTTLVSLNLLNQNVLEQLKVEIGGHKTDLIKNVLSILGIILGLGLISLYVSINVSRSITKPIDQLVGVMQQLAAGDDEVRSNIDTKDEIGTLARQFDTMIDQREAINVKIREENETLNNSIINLLQAVASLAQRDLTVKAPVAEDITGPVGDALNYLSDETAKVLNQVVRIADGVAQASQQVKAQADTVITIAGEENQEVQRAAAELTSASEAMLDIAKLALSCNEAASKAIQTTDKAQVTVLSTVQGITSIRDTIRETEKRIKRLGERSQEIGSVITIINGIAERTHILALNASMHAASAGEAGKGFAVVANEVQKLAENAREATQQISNLVNNIQVETADTVATMNEAITQVVQGTTLAQQAGSEMRETRDTTAELVQLVERIAENSKEQAETTLKIRERSMMIQQSSAETFNQLQEQGKQTEKLVAFSGNLVKSVGVFTLPKPDESQLADLVA